MSTNPHLPCLRLGKPYLSLNQTEVVDCRDGSIRATLSHVNPGVIRRDLQSIGLARAALQKFSTAELIELCRRAGDAFLKKSLPLGDGGECQNPQEYVETLSSTSGLPHVMVRRNMEKIHYALTHMEPF